MFYFDHSRYIDLKKDRRDFAKQIYPAFKWKKKKRKLSLSWRMLPSTPFIGDRELNIHRNRFEPRQKTPPTPSSLLVYGNCDTFQGTTRVPPQSNMHLTFMNLSDPLNFYPRLEAEERLLAGISIVALVV